MIRAEDELFIANADMTALEKGIFRLKTIDFPLRPVQHCESLLQIQEKKPKPPFLKIFEFIIKKLNRNLEICLLLSAYIYGPVEGSLTKVREKDIA